MRPAIKNLIASGRVEKGMWWELALRVNEGCTKVSTGCLNCWSETQCNIRSNNPKMIKQYPPEVLTSGKWNGQIKLLPQNLELPLKRKKPTVWAVWNDLFHPSMSIDYIDKVLGIIDSCPQHIFIILTKRPATMAKYFEDIKTPFRIAKASDILKVKLKMATINLQIKSIKEYPGYFIGSNGIVYSDHGSTICLYCGLEIKGSAKKKYCSKKCNDNACYHRKIGQTQPNHFSQPAPMSPDIGEQGHMRVMLYKDGGSRRELVHRLVLSAFGRPAKKGEQCCHKDGNPLNNHIANLQWGSQSDNWQDRIRHGNGQAHKSNNTLIKPPISLPLKNCFVGITAETQQMFDKRWAILKQIPAAVYMISYEPALGPLLLPPDFLALGNRAWLVCGGESGSKARPMHPDYARGVRDQCVEAGVPFFFKQWGEWVSPCQLTDKQIIKIGNAPKNWGTLDINRTYFSQTTPWNGKTGKDSETGEYVIYKVGKKAAGRLLDGETWNQFPEVA